MSDLEQRIKEAAEKADDDDAEPGEIEAWYEIASPFNIKALLAEKDAEIADLKTQLEQEASADIQINEQIGSMYAEIESLKRDLESTDEALEAQVIKYENCPHEMVVGVTCACSHDAPSDVCSVHAPQLRKAQEELESLKARAERWEKVAWEKVAADYRNYHKDTPRSCSIFNSADKRCDICRAYDALDGPREGEQR